MIKNKTLKITLLLIFIFIFLFLSKTKVHAITCYYNACNVGPICHMGEQYYSVGDYIVDDTIDFYTEEMKIVPHPDFAYFRRYICLRTGTSYCEIGAVRPNLNDPYGALYQCQCNGSATDFEPCNTSGNPTGTWMPTSLTQQGDCQDMEEDMDVGFTPGYIETRTPYLYNIWQNTVNKTQSLFTPFRTVFDKPKFQWPGMSTIQYTFENPYDPYTDDYKAEAGYPPYAYPGWYAKFYFRYLGYIHCVKENFLQKLAPLLEPDYPYIYYDERCNIDLW